MFNFIKKQDKYTQKTMRPVYFLFTRTLERDYEYKNKFPEDEQIRKNLHNLFNNVLDDYAYKSIEEPIFISKESSKYKILCYKFWDGRKDDSSRRCYSFFGVFVDVNDRNFDDEGFKNESKERIREMLRKKDNCYTMAQHFPVIWDNEKLRGAGAISVGSNPR